MNWHNLPIASSLEHDDSYNDLRTNRGEALQLGAIQDPDTTEPANLWSLKHYQYSALPDIHSYIRVLCLERPREVSGWRKTTVPCATIIVLPLPTEGTISALSYVWGNPNKACPVLIDGCVVWVTESLNAALERLQEDDRILLLWVDAICINQSDLEEKSAQVQQMGNIYNMAKHVLGWIGPAADGSEVAMKALAFVGKACHDMPDGPCLEERLRLFEEVLSEDSSGLETDFPITQVIAIFMRPWWTRIWVSQLGGLLYPKVLSVDSPRQIVQEVNLAESVHVICGSSSVTYRHILLAFTALMELLLLNAKFDNALDNRIKGLAALQTCNPRLIESSMNGIGSKIPLAMRLIRVAGFGATNPIDHIYALIGLTSDMEELGIVADYKKTCPQVYIQVATALLLRQNNLQILARSRNPKLVPGLPSWVPDWSQPPPIMIWNPRFPVYSAGKCSLKQDLRAKNTELTVRGIVTGRVEQLGWSWNSLSAKDLEDVPKTIQRGLDIVQEFLDAHCFAYTTPGEKEDAMWRTPILDVECGVFGESERYNRRATEPMRRVYQNLRSSSDLPDPSLEEYKHRYFAAIAFLQNRRYFATSTGHLGLGPLDMRTGDFVCVLIDGDVPFVVRREGGQSGPVWFRKWQTQKYHLVGESYVHKMMDGESWEEQMRVEDIVLV
jgi:hypothetical protein